MIANSILSIIQLTDQQVLAANVAADNVINILVRRLAKCLDDLKCIYIYVYIYIYLFAVSALARTLLPLSRSFSKDKFSKPLVTDE